MKVMQLIIKEKSQFQVFARISLAAAIIFAMLYRLNPAIFRKFFGEIDPFLIIFVAIVSGFFSFVYLLQNSKFSILKMCDHANVYRSYLWAALLAILVIVLVDLRGGYSKNINVLFPESLLFYHAIGFVVEILFHVLPMTIFLFISSLLFRNMDGENTVFVIMIIVSLIEPIYQILLGKKAFWVEVYQTVHILLINLIQVYLFRRYDFVSMYSFRLVYYFFWHIL